jgi:hypothetical protein
MFAKRALSLLFLGLISSQSLGGCEHSQTRAPAAAAKNDTPMSALTSRQRARPAGSAAQNDAANYVADPRVVLVTIDGVQWQDVFAGLGDAAGQEAPVADPLVAPYTPNLHRLTKERGVLFGGGACKHEVRAKGPYFVSLPGYFEIFTGAASDKCATNECGQVQGPTFVDDVRKSAKSANDVAVFASWGHYARAATVDTTKTFVAAASDFNALVAKEADPVFKAALGDGAQAGPYPGWGDYRADAFTSRAALRYLELHRPKLMVLGLGDTDEYGHRWDRNGYLRALRKADDTLGELSATLARMGSDGQNTVVLVTTDHGRASNFHEHGPEYPESARVFFAAFGGGLSARGAACASETMYLTEIASTVKTLLGHDAPVSTLTAEIAESMPSVLAAR